MEAIVENVEGKGEIEAGILESATGTISTCFNGINALSGIGILSIPYAVSSGGWLSLTLLFVFAIVAFYTGLLIQRCMDVDPNIKTYPDIGERAFGRKCRWLILFFMNIELYLIATGFLILEGDILHKLFPNVDFEIAGLQLGGRQSFVMIVGLIIVPTVWLNNMSILSYVSATGVLTSFIILGSTFSAAAFDGIGFNQKGTTLNWKGVPTAISLYALCYCGHPVFPTLYTSMKHKRQFSKVLVLCFILCTTANVSMAVIGYLMFGSKVESQITLNLPIEKLSSKVAIYTTLVNPISRYALMVTPIVNNVESRFQQYCRSKRLFSLLFRTIFVISTIVVAITVPFFGYLMSFVGAFLGFTTSILLPCLCYLKISGAYRRPGFEVVIIGVIMLLGTSTAIIGTYTALVDIIGHLTSRR